MQEKMYGVKRLLTAIQQNIDVNNLDILARLLNYNESQLKEDIEAISYIEVQNKDGLVKELEVSGLFIAVGKVPSNDIFKDVVELDKDGYIIASEDCHTSEKGIFVAGDNRQKLLRQLVTATSDGAMAATEAIKYIRNLD